MLVTNMAVSWPGSINADRAIYWVVEEALTVFYAKIRAIV